MTVAHAGFALIILGITGSTTWEVEKLQVMRPGESVDVAGYSVRFEGVRELQGPNYTALQGAFAVSRDGRPIALLTPESRSYPHPPMQTTEAAIRPTAGGDLYAVVGDPDGAGGWATRLYHKPFIQWIWFGSLVAMIGGLISLTDRRLRVAAPRRSAAAAPKLEPKPA